MVKYVAPKLPPTFNAGACDICSGTSKLKNLKDPNTSIFTCFFEGVSEPGEWRCEDCIKAINDAAAQKRYLHSLQTK